MTTVHTIRGESTMRSFSHKLALFATAVSTLFVVACSSTTATFNPPANVKASGGLHQVTITWDAVPNAATYVVLRGTKTGGPYTEIARTTNTTYTDANLANGASFIYVVRAISSAGVTSNVSNEATAAAMDVPAAPAGVTAAYAGGKITVSWTATPSGTDTYTVYKATKAGGPYGLLGTTTAVTIVDSDVQLGSSYFYIVQATNVVGTGAASAEASTITPPVPPQNASATATSATHIQINYSLSASATSYTVKRGIASGTWATTVTCAATPDVPPPAGQAACVDADTALTTDVTYFYVVTATNAGGTSDNSLETRATLGPGKPAAPTNLAATASNYTINLTWTASAKATSYLVFRGTAAGAEGTTAIGSSGGPFYTDVNLAPGTAYFYVVQAVGPGGTSGNSNEATATTPASAPSTPIGISTAPGFEKITVSWLTSAGATSYQVFRSATTDFTPCTTTAQLVLVGSVAAPVAGSTQTFTDSGIAPYDTGTPPHLGDGQTYCYAIQAVNATGNSPASSRVPGYTVPGIATNVKAFGNGPPPPSATLGIQLTWSPAPGATMYNVYRASTTQVGATPPAYTLVSPVGCNPGVGGLAACVFGTSFTDNTVTPNLHYYYVIQGVYQPVTGVILSGPNSIEVTGTTRLVPPSLLSLVPDLTPAQTPQVTLTWNGSPGALGYTVFRSTFSGGGYTQVGVITTNAQTNITLIDASLGNGLGGTQLFYVVRAINDTNGNAATSANSNELSVLSFPPQVTGVAAVPGNAQISLTWAADSISPMTTTGYTVFRVTGATGGTYAPIKTITFADPTKPITSFTDNTGLTNGTPYRYVVAGLNASTTGTKTGQPSAELLAAVIPSANSFNATAMNNWVTDTADVQRPNDESQIGTIVAWQLQSDGGFVQSGTGVGTADGLISVPNVDGGTLYVQHNASGGCAANNTCDFTVTTSRTMDFGNDILGRPDFTQTDAGVSDEIDFQLGNLSNWNQMPAGVDGGTPSWVPANTEDHLEFISTNAAEEVFKADTVFNNGVPTANAQVYGTAGAPVRYFRVRKPLLDTNKGDSVFLADLAGTATTNNSLVEAVQRVFFLAPFTSLRGTLTFVGNFSPVTNDQTLPVTLKRSTLKSDAVVAAIHPSATSAAQDVLRIMAAPGYVAQGTPAPAHGLFALGNMPNLVYFKSADMAAGNSSTDIALATVKYGNPYTGKSFAARYGTVAEADANVNVNLDGRTWNVGLSYVDSVTAFASFASNSSQAPVIGPIPPNPATTGNMTFYFQVGTPTGACTVQTPPVGCFAANNAAQTLITGLGTSPLLVWTAAAGATHYVVEIYQTSGGGGAIGSPVARIRTAGTNTNIQIPPGVLFNGNNYVALVWSYKEPTRDLTKPYRGLAAGNVARAPAFTNPFTP
jgi:fibronectin type 3 domain-containing protein